MLAFPAPFARVASLPLIYASILIDLEELDSVLRLRHIIADQLEVELLEYDIEK